MQLQRMLSFAYSAASPRVACRLHQRDHTHTVIGLRFRAVTPTAVTAPLLVAYHNRFGGGLGALMLLKLINSPGIAFCLKYGTQTRVLKYTGFTLTRHMRSTSSSGTSSDARVVDHDVQRTKSRAHGEERPLPVGFERYVALEGDGMAAGLRGCGGGGDGGVDVPDEDAGALGAEFGHDARAETGPAAGDDGGFGVQAAGYGLVVRLKV